MMTTRESRLEIRRMQAALLCALAIATSLLACSSRESFSRYDAERKLYKARKLAGDALSSDFKPEFLARASDAYRSIVKEYAPAANSSQSMEEIVVSAQMELSELEFRAGSFREARTDFEKAIEIAKRTPAARANAIYSIAVISEELGERAEAIAAYERFAEEFLQDDSLASTARMNARYLVTPLKLADLFSRNGRSGEAERWYREAERIYSSILQKESDESILKETRFNLLTTLLQKKNWKRALDFAAALRELYPEPADASKILFIEAKINEAGLKNLEESRALYLSIADRFPKSENAAAAILAAASIDRRAGRSEEARKLYQRTIQEYRERIGECVEANWQLAEMDEKDGLWEEASLRYKKIYSDYPETLQGFEAPLRIAKTYDLRGEKDAAAAAYERAIEHYKKLAEGQRRPSTKIMAEQYFIRALSEAKRWRETAERLTKLPDIYPDYEPFKANYLSAASIYEKELNEPENAVRTLELCIAKYPGTDLARSAEKELTRLKRGRK